jgi:hydrogenase nickel incorporation protein HypA/HybF
VHELSIALSIVEGALSEASRNRGRVTAVHLKLGPLAGVVGEALTFAYDLACEGTPLDGSRLVIEPSPVRVLCPICAQECAPVSPPLLSCSVCGSTAVRVVSGDELELAALEMEI